MAHRTRTPVEIQEADKRDVALERRKLKKLTARSWYRNNKARARETGRLYRGLPKPTRPCPDRCECCGGPPIGRGRTLHLDHCHATGEFRGWLCSNCNTAIGKLGDSLVGVLKAASYLIWAAQ